MNNSCYIKAFSAYVPEAILTNSDLAAMVDTNDEWIISRTGISSRHILAPDENNSDAAFQAASAAIAKSGFTPADFSHVIVGTCTPDYFCPSVATMLAGRLKMPNVMAFDFNAACSGFIYGLEIARSIVLSKPTARILLVCSEALSRRVNFKDRATCVLFGDGAGAVIIDAQENGAKAEIVDLICKSDGKLGHLITIGGGTHKKYTADSKIEDDFFIHMHGQEVYRQAVRCMTASCRELLKNNEFTIEDIDVFVPHQANLRIIEAVGQRLGVLPNKVFINVAEYGNTSAASVPIAIFDALEQGRICTGAKVLITAVGGGFTFGTGLLQF